MLFLIQYIYKMSQWFEITKSHSPTADPKDLLSKKRITFFTYNGLTYDILYCHKKHQSNLSSFFGFFYYLCPIFSSLPKQSTRHYINQL